jgi:hypothetical protein
MVRRGCLVQVAETVLLRYDAKELQKLLIT